MIGLRSRRRGPAPLIMSVIQGVLLIVTPLLPPLFGPTELEASHAPALLSASTLTRETRTPPPPGWRAPFLPSVSGEMQISSAELLLNQQVDTGLGDNTTIYNGDWITYTLALTNISDQELTDINLINILPRNTLKEQSIFCSPECGRRTFEQEIPEPSGSTVVVTVTRELSWTVSTLASGQELNFTFGGQVIGQPSGTVFTNRAAAQYHIGEETRVVMAPDSDITVLIRPPAGGGATISQVPSWFSSDLGGTISQDWGDFDGDGDLDLALGSSLGVSVYTNRDGNLERIWTSPPALDGNPRFSYGVVWADVIPETKGWLDLIVVGHSENRSAMEYGVNYIYSYDPQQQEFVEARTFTSHLQLVRVIAGDFDGSGHIDLIASTNAINGLRDDLCPVNLYRNDGTGHFTGTTTISAPDSVVCISEEATAALSAADFDGNGSLDLALGAFPSMLKVLPNLSHQMPITTGNPFTTAIVLESDLQYLPYDMAWGDYNEDGQLDLVVAYPIQREARVYTEGPDGMGLVSTLRTDAFMTPLSVDWGDFDGDGHLNLVVADTPPKFYRYSAQPHEFTSLNHLSLPATGTDWGQIWGTRGVALTDDRTLDLVLANRNGSSALYTILAPKLSSDFTPVGQMQGAGFVAWGDSNSNGYLDLIFGAGSGSSQINSYLYINRDGQFPMSYQREYEATGFGPHVIAFGDMDRDGRQEVAIGTAVRIQVYDNGEYRTPLWQISLPTDRPVRSLAWGDANDNGYLDLIVGFSRGPVELYLNEETATGGRRLSMTPSFTTPDEGNARAIAWGDFNNDYYLDFAVAFENGPLRIYHNEGDGSFTPLNWNAAGHRPYRALAWADYNQNGYLDLAVGVFGEDDLLWENQGGFFGTEPIWSTAGDPLSKTTSLAWGDWDNDGYPELAIGRREAPDVVYANLRSQPGFPQLVPLWTAPITANTTALAWGDRDNDGDLDLAVSHAEDTRGNGYYENTLTHPVHLPTGRSGGLVNNPPYVHVLRPGQTDAAYFHSASEILADPDHPTVTVKYRAHDAEGDDLLLTYFEYSLDGGSRWQQARPAAGYTNPVTQTSVSGVAGEFVWAAAEDAAVSDHALFRVRVVSYNPTGPVQSVIGSAVSPPFRVRALTCHWPADVSISVSSPNPVLGEEVVFEAEVGTASGQVTHRWNFGDGSPEVSGGEVKHTFQHNGEFRVRLTVLGQACPYARPAYATRVITVTGSTVYLPLVMSNYTSSSAAAASAPVLDRAPRTIMNETPQPRSFPVTAPRVLQGATPTSHVPAPGITRISPYREGYNHQPAVNADGSRIVYWSTARFTGNNDDGSIEIFLTEATEQGFRHTQITSSTGTILGGFNLAPSIDATGKHIAFFSDRDLTGENPDLNLEIFLAIVQENEDPQLIQVTRTNRGVNIMPNISADGRYITFVSDNDLANTGSNGKMEIFRAEIEYSPTLSEIDITFIQVTTSTAEVPFNDSPVISADGRFIAYVTDQPSAGNPAGKRHIVRAEIQDGGNISYLHISNNGVTNAAQPAISGDGARVIYVGSILDDNTREVYLMEVAGDGSVQNVSFPKESGGKAHPVLSANGMRIAYYNDENNLVEVYDLTDTQYLSSTERASSYPAFSGNGALLAYAAGGNIYLKDYPLVDLTVGKWGEPASIGIHDLLTYTLTVTNHGPSSAINATVVDTLPVGIRPLVSPPQTYTRDIGTDDWTAHGSTLPGESELSTTHVYTSPVFQDTSGVNNWGALSWIPARIVGTALPDYGVNEGDHYPPGVTGTVDMTGNFVLLHFDDPPGSSNFLDTSGMEHDGRCMGATCPAVIEAGIFERALSFNGYNNYVSLGAASSLNVTDTLTMEAWVYPTQSRGALFYRENDYGYGLYHHSSYGLVWSVPERQGVHRYYRVVQPSSSLPVMLPANEWSHLAVVFNMASPSAIVFLNGVEYDGSSMLGTAYASLGHNEAIIGNAAFTLFGPFQGRMDEVAYYRRALSQPEIENRYRRGALQIAAQVRGCPTDPCDETIPFVGPAGTNSVFTAQDSNRSGPPSVRLQDINGPYAQYRFFLASRGLTTGAPPALSNVALDPRVTYTYTLSSPAVITWTVATEEIPLQVGLPLTLTLVTEAEAEAFVGNTPIEDPDTGLITHIITNTATTLSGQTEHERDNNVGTAITELGEVALDGVSLDCPAYAGTSRPAVLTATVSPLMSNPTITYTWDFPPQSPFTRVDGMSSTEVYSWTNPQETTVEVSAANSFIEETALDPVTDACTIIVVVPVEGLRMEIDPPILVNETTVLTAAIDAGTDVTYRWEFDDETSIETPDLSLNHVFLLTGTHTITLTAYNGYNSEWVTETITVIDHPITGLALEDNGPVLLDAPSVLTATVDTGTNIRYTWDFGDGTAPVQSVGALEPAPVTISHTYAEPGSYTVTVAATNFHGVTPVTATRVVTVHDHPISGLTLVSDAPTEVGHLTLFTATLATGTNVLYTWDFGDGTIQEVVGPREPGTPITQSHAFSSEGPSTTYTVTVTATNFNPDDGDEASTTVTIIRRCWVQVQESPHPLHPSVQAAIQAAKSGYTLRLAGTCSLLPGQDQVALITKDLVLEGGYSYEDLLDPNPIPSPGHLTTLDGLGQGRVVSVIGASVTLENLRLTGGFASGPGAGVYALSADLTLENSVIERNQGEGAGAGVYLEAGSATLRNNSITENTLLSHGNDGYGGGLAFFNIPTSTLVLEANAILSNTLRVTGGDAYGGGLYLQNAPGAEFRRNRFLWNESEGETAFGGGLALQDSEGLHFENTVVASNHSSGSGSGLYLEASDASTFYYSTFHNNSGGGGEGLRILGSANVVFYNSILAAQECGGYFASGVPTFHRWLVHQNDADWCGDAPAGDTPITGDPDFITTHHIGPQSAAINAGIDVGITEDVDSELRPANGGYDLGADEYRTCHINLNGTPHGTIQDAVGVAAQGDVIKIAGLCVGIDAQVTLNTNVTLRGGYRNQDWDAFDPVAHPTILDAEGVGRVVTITGGSPILEGLHITGGQDEHGGGVYIANASPTLSSLWVYSNTATQNGGGLYIWNAAPNLTNNVIADNQAPLGAGLYVTLTEPHLVELQHITLANNEAHGLYADLADGALNVYNSIVAGNTTGIAAETGTVVVSGVLWHDNITDTIGGVAVSGTQAGDPAFRNPNAGDYAIGVTSAAIDGALPPTASQDITGQSRPAVYADLGAYETESLHITKVGPERWDMNTPLAYTLTITNAGIQTAITVTDTIPDGANFVNATAGGQQTEDTVTWTRSSFAPDEVFQPTFTVTAMETITNATYAVTGALGSSTSGAPEVTTYIAPPALEIVKSGPAWVNVDEQIVYTLWVTNTGSSIGNIVITDTLPAEAEYVAGSGGTYDANSHMVTWDLSSSGTTLAYGESLSVACAVTADETITNTHYGVQAANVGTGELVSASGQVAVATWVPAELSITKSGPEESAPGELIAYTLAVHNSGGRARGVVVTDVLPEGTEYVSSSPTGTHTPDTNTITWTTNSIRRNRTVYYTVYVRAWQTITNANYSVRSNTLPTQPGYPPVTTTIAPSLSIIKTAPPTATVDAHITYVLTVTNQGGLANGVVITDTVPEHATFVSASEGATPVSGLLTWTVAELPYDTSVTRTFTVTAQQTIVNHDYGVDATNGDPASGDPVSTIIAPQFTLTKTAPLTAAVNTDITYVLTVTNQGGLATGTVLTDAIPLGATVTNTGGGTLIDNDQAIRWSLGDLAYGDERVYTFAVIATQTLVNDDYRLSSDGGYEMTGEEVITIIRPEISLTKSGPLTATATADITYVLTVTNQGGLATGVVITDTVPEHAGFISASHGGSESNGIVIWPALDLPYNTSLSRTFIVTATQTITNDDYAVAVPDYGIFEQGTSAVTTVIAPDLEIEKDAPGSVAIGEAFTYILTVRNDGGLATGLVITDTLPAGATFIEASEGITPDANELLSWIINDPLAYGESISCTFTVTTTQPLTNHDYGVRADGGYRATGAPVETAITPDLTLTKSGPATATVGTYITYALTVTNNGGLASGLIITDVIPAEAALVGISHEGSHNSGIVSWSLDTLDGYGTQATRFFTVTASQTIINDDYAVSLPGQFIIAGVPAVTTEIEPVLEIEKIAFNSVAAGQPLTYTLTVHNTGGLATGLIITDTLPDGASFIRASQEIAPDGNGRLTWTIDDPLPHGESISRTFTVTATETLVNQDYGVRADGGHSATGDPVTTIITLPNLTISKEGPTSVALADPIVYTLTVTNNGGPATNIIITDVVPVNATFVSFSHGGDHLNGIVSWNLDTLDGGGAQATRFFTITASQAITNEHYAVSANHIATVPGTEAIHTSIEPGLSLIKSGPSTATVGTNITYILTVTNQGGPATGVILTDTIPLGATVVSTGGGSLIDGGKVISWTIGALTGGGSPITRTFTVTATQTITNEDYAVSIPGLLFKAGDIAITTVISPELHIAAAVTPTNIIAGQEFTYTLSVTNDGGLAHNVMITNIIPVEAYFVSASEGITPDGEKRLQWSLSQLPHNETVFYTFTVRASETLTNEHYGLCAEAGPCATGISLITEIEEPLLAITKSGPATATVNSPITYVLTVTNTGGPAVGLVITDALPLNATIVNTGGGTLIDDGRFLSWMVRDIVSTTRSITRTFAVSATRNITNEHYAVSLPGLPVFESGDVSATTTIAPILAITKTAPYSVLSGQEFAFTLYVTNTGGLATGVILTESLPLEANFVRADGGIMPNDRLLTWVLSHPLSHGISISRSFVITISDDITNVHAGVWANGGYQASLPLPVVVRIE